MLRRRIEHRSRPLLTRLHRLPRLVIPLATLGLVAIGVFAPLPAALAALLLLVVFLAWITYLAWPAIPTSGRLLRLVMVASIVVLAVTRL